jgi:CRISPR system Cascade subunit CasB
MGLKFEPNSPELKVLLVWWHGLDNDRGARAELKRCHDLLSVVQTPAFHAVRQRLVDAGVSESDSKHNRLPAVVALLSHLKNGSEKGIAEDFSDGDPPRVSPLRFRQILDARTDDELFKCLRRVLPLVKNALNQTRLAKDVMHWGDKVRKRWVYAYRWPKKSSN